MSGGLTVEVGCSAKGWAGALPGAEAVAHRAANAAWKAAGDGAAELSILLSGDEEVRMLNRDYRSQDKPTNVLSFPAG
ncbi:MAG: rRNA maturation RNAse YbeY, partial [Alphaproteobacteria bacterium]|nr:rRNA maturation RNAse YbeY [Alphaproteobacteria bacterium]